MNPSKAQSIPPQITFDEFLKVDIRAGTVLSAIINEKARQIAYILEIDFGELGIKKSSAQIVQNHTVEDLVGSQVLAVVNFPPKRVAGVKSEVLVLAVVDDVKGTILIRPSQEAQNGSRVL